MERPTKERLRLMAMGVGLGLALVAGLAGLMPTNNPRSLVLGAGCVRYFLVPVEWICGSNVVYVNPDGSKVNIGKTKDLLPMPRPRPVQSRP
jgi:hypothetical protein